MSVNTQSKQTPKFTSMEEMKRWQGEREDQLHRERKEQTPPQGLERLAKYAERDRERRRSELVSEMVTDIRKRRELK